MEKIYVVAFWLALLALLVYSWTSSSHKNGQYLTWWKNNIPVISTEKLSEEKDMLEKLEAENGLCEDSKEVYKMIVQELEKRQKDQPV